jgi:LPS-assembly protein
VTRRFLLVLFLLASATASLKAAGMPELSATSTDTDPATGDQVFLGHARLDYDGALLLGDEIRYNVAKQIATARGHVSLTRGAQRLLADEIIYRLADKTYSVTRLHFGQYPLYASGDQVDGDTKDIVLHHANLAYHEPGPFVPTLIAEKLTIIPGDRIIAERAWLGLGTTPLIPLHSLEQSATDPLISHVSATLNQSHTLGYYAELGMHLPVAPGIKIGGDVGLYTSRGILVGPSGTYHRIDDDLETSGSFQTGYINDHGEKQTDVLNRPIHDNRAFIDWYQQQQLTAKLTLQTQLNYWSDSDVVRDFRGSEFSPVQQPDSFVDATATGTNTVTSLFIRAQPNTYYHVQQRLPEFRFDLLPTAIGNGFYERFNASGVALREREFSMDAGVLATAPTIKSNRLDAFYSLSRPIAPREWFVIDPVAGARVTHYLNALDGKTTYTRALGEIGVDASLRTSGTYAYKNDRWDPPSGDTETFVPLHSLRRQRPALHSANR